MQKVLLTFMLLSLLSDIKAQSTYEYCVRLTATVQESPVQITLHWPFDTAGVHNYYVNRKEKNSTFWGTGIAALPQTAVSFKDTTVVADSAYEYKVSKSGTINAEGYIFAGIKAPVTEYRGKLLLIVDSTFNDSLSTQLHRLMKDISGDGWAIKRFDVDTADPDYAVKSLIQSEYFSDSNNVKAVLLVGHVAVPYSGRINPDGHPNHLGAWPADVFYGNMHSTFTDQYIDDDTSAYRPENQNIPGDGKWDQSTVPSYSQQLEVSRIDFAKMTAFGKTPNQLMISYLDKDHAYRMKNINTIPRGLIDDNFGAFSGEAFAISGWRNFTPILGDTNIVEADYISTLDTSNFQWSYGCGGGSFTSAGGIGSTTDFVTHNVKSIFTMLFGSYFGDWDSDNDFLRAPLCAPEPALTSCWAGRPAWPLHHMALGENIGYSARLAQNTNFALYFTNYGDNFVHIALMGDLTLRQHIIAPPAIVSLTDTNETATLTWAASTDSVLGYNVYRCLTEFGQYHRINNNLITGNTYTDAYAGPGLKFYMVRAMRLESTPSGTYYNLSEGVSDSIRVRDTVMISTGVVALDNRTIELNIHPNPASDLLMLDIDAAGSENFEIGLFDATGRKMDYGFAGSGNTQTAIDVSSFPGGIYFCRLSTRDGVIMKRFEVQ